LQEEKCIICESELNLFSKEPITEILCFNCFQNQDDSWKRKIKKFRNQPEKIKELIDEITEQNQVEEIEDENKQETSETKDSVTAASPLLEPEPPVKKETPKTESKTKKTVSKSSKIDLDTIYQKLEAIEQKNDEILALLKKE